MTATDRCEGQRGEFFVCSGKKTLVKFITSAIGIKDFNITSELYIEKKQETAASFVFFTRDKKELHFGLDGKNRR